MKVNKSGNGYYLLTSENSETLKDIAIAIILASYKSAIPYGYGFTRPYKTELTKEMADSMLRGEDISRDYITNRNKKNEVDMDYVFGRCCKTYLIVEDNKVKINISERDRNPEKIIQEAKKILKELNKND